MKKSKFSEEQIAMALRQIDAGAPVLEVTRKLGISEATYYVWRKRYGQMAVAEIRRLRQLEEENSRLKQLVADLTLDKVILQEVLAKKKLCRVPTMSNCGTEVVRSSHSVHQGGWHVLLWHRCVHQIDARVRGDCAWPLHSTNRSSDHCGDYPNTTGAVLPEGSARRH